MVNAAPAADTGPATVPVPTTETQTALPQEADTQVAETEVTETEAPVTEAPVTEAPVTEAPVTGTAGTQVSDTQVAATPPADAFAVPVPDAAEPTQYGDASAASRILIRSRSAAWVEITEPGGNVLLTRLLRPGDSFQVPDRPGITLVTGNAGGLEFVVDGTTAPAIGDIGDVRRDVLLEPEALLQGAAASEN